MTKNKKIALILALALLLSVIAGWLVFQYLTPKRETIYTFNSAYAAGTPVIGNMLIPIQVDADIIVAGRAAPVSEQYITAREISAVLQTGDSLRMDVGKGTPLTMALLSVTGGSSIEQNMAPSSVSVTIPLNNITGITQELQAGSRVNIYISSEMAGQETSLPFQNMRVLQVFQDESGSLTGVSIETVTTEQALRLINAATYNSIYLGLVDANGYKTAEGIPSYSPLS